MGAARVLRVIARMNVGGPAVEISGLMRHLDTGQFDQRLVTGWCDAHEEDYLTTQAPDIHVTRVSGLGRAVRPTDDAAAFWRLVQEIKRFRPHILHTHTAKAGALGRAAAQVSGIRPILIHTYHGHLLNGYFSPSKTRAVVQIERALGSRTDHFITVGAQVRDQLLAAGIGRPEKYSVIPPGLEPLTYPTRSAARAELRITEDAPVICVVGRVTAIKRPDRVADVAARLASSHPGAVVLVAGSGDLMDDLRSRVDHENLPIRLLGWCDDVATVFAASDLALLTSDNEGTPLSLIQAAMAGIPSVATDVGAVSEIVVDGETGLLTRCDSDELAAAVAHLIDDPSRRRALGEAGRLRAAEQYGVRRFVDAHASVYEAELARKRR